MDKSLEKIFKNVVILSEGENMFKAEYDQYSGLTEVHFNEDGSIGETHTPLAGLPARTSGYFGNDKKQWFLSKVVNFKGCPTLEDCFKDLEDPVKLAKYKEILSQADDTNSTLLEMQKNESIDCDLYQQVYKQLSGDRQNIVVESRLIQLKFPNGDIINMPSHWLHTLILEKYTPFNQDKTIV